MVVKVVVLVTVVLVIVVVAVLPVIVTYLVVAVVYKGGRFEHTCFGLLSSCITLCLTSRNACF